MNLEQGLRTLNQGDIRNIIGIVVVNDKYTEKDTIKLYNDKGSLWYKFTFYYDDSDGEFDYPNKEFIPQAFNPDYFLLALAVVEKDATGYKVIVNKVTGLEKRIKKESFLQYLTFDQYILSAFSVSFQYQQNLIHKEPIEGSEIVPFIQEIHYHPVKIQGEWLQIKWGIETDWHYGWIKWKDKNRLLVEIHHYA